MNKYTKLFLCIIITMICLVGLVSAGSSASSAFGQGNGDNWGVDIFTDNWSEQNVTTTKSTIKETTEKKTLKETASPKENNDIKRTSVKKIVIKKRTAKIYLKALKGVTGYKVKFSTSSKFSKAKTKSVSVKKARFTIRKISKAKKYYVKARAFKKSNGKVYFGRWSKVKTKKI